MTEINFFEITKNTLFRGLTHPSCIRFELKTDCFGISKGYHQNILDLLGVRNPSAPPNYYMMIAI